VPPNHCYFKSTGFSLISITASLDFETTYMYIYIYIYIYIIFVDVNYKYIVNKS